MGHSFQPLDHFREALRHRSFIHEHPGVGASNERLEFLGDAVLELVVTLGILRLYPDLSEGVLSPLRTALIRTESLAKLGRAWGVGPCLELGRGEDDSGGRDRASMLECAVEALIGAVYLDGGLGPCEAVLGSWVEEQAQRAREVGGGVDSKTRLQEYYQARGLGAPQYKVMHREGPDHAPVFHVDVYGPEGILLGQGVASTKKEAEKLAAEQALTRIEEIPS
jgi:ribonuclease-3